MPTTETIAELLGNQTERPSAARVLQNALENAEMPDGTNGAIHAYSGDQLAR